MCQNHEGSDRIIAHSDCTAALDPIANVNAFVKARPGSGLQYDPRKHTKHHENEFGYVSVRVISWTFRLTQQMLVK